MAENVLGVLFKNIADAIRSKTGNAGTLVPNQFPTAINSIKTEVVSSDIEVIHDALDEISGEPIGEIILSSGDCGEQVAYVLKDDGSLRIYGDGRITSAPWAAEHKNAIVEVIIEEGVTSIGDSEWIDAFYGCSRIESVALPSSLTSIGARSFVNCTNLTSIVIPSNVVSIAHAAFVGCDRLNQVIFQNTIGWTIEDSETFVRIQVSSADLSDTEVAAQYLTDTYADDLWIRM